MPRILSLLSLFVVACGTAPAEPEVQAPIDDVDAPLVAPNVVLNAPIPADAAVVPGRVIVGLPQVEMLQSLDVSGLRTGPARLQLVEQLGGLSAAVYALPEGADVREAVADLRASGRFLYVEPDYVVEALATPNDPYYSYQWHFAAIDAASAWDLSTGSGVVVAVVDTGVSSGPYDGIASIGAGYDFINNDSNASDDNGHGTHVAGTIAQATNNGQGVAGLAYGATIMPIKVLNAAGSGSTSGIINGINYAVSNGAQVINMSLGGGGYSSSFATAIQNAANAGVFVAVASGNSGGSTVEYPAAYAGAVAVGATDYNNAVTYYSNRGTALDLVAPGGDTSQDANGDGYADGVLQETFESGSWGYSFFEGTSMATPHVAGAAALLMSQGATAAEAETLLKSTATDLGSSGFDNTSGYGLIQPAAALAAYLGGGGGTGGDGGGGGSDGGGSDGGGSDGGGGGGETYTTCSGYDALYTGSLAGAGSVAYEPGGSDFYVGGRSTIDLCLGHGSDDDFDLVLYKWNSRRGWQAVASANSSGGSESLSYRAGKGYYIVEVSAYAGSGSYELGLSY